jgi:hypothetical protein
MRVRRRALTIHVEQAVSEVVPEPERERPPEQPAPPPPDVLQAELERLRRDAMRTAAEGYGD